MTQRKVSEKELAQKKIDSYIDEHVGQAEQTLLRVYIADLVFQTQLEKRDLELEKIEEQLKSIFELPLRQVIYRKGKRYEVCAWFNRIWTEDSSNLPFKLKTEINQNQPFYYTIKSPDVNYQFETPDQVLSFIKDLK